MCGRRPSSGGGDGRAPVAAASRVCVVCGVACVWCVWCARGCGRVGIFFRTYADGFAVGTTRIILFRTYADGFAVGTTRFFPIISNFIIIS